LFKEYAILEKLRDARPARHLLDNNLCPSFGASALAALTSDPQKFIDPLSSLFFMDAGDDEEDSFSGGTECVESV
jgi:hypothetical protein